MTVDTEHTNLREQDAAADETLQDAASPSPEEMTPGTVDVDRYYSLDELAVMQVETLEELWQACPERPFYETALEQAVEAAYGPEELVSDLDRLTIIDECITYLRESPPRIPMTAAPGGEVKWFRVSDRIVEHLRTGVPLTEASPEESLLRHKPPIVAAIIGGVFLFACVLVMLVNRATHAKSEALTLTVTAQAAEQLAVSSAPTATPTPLALEDIDRPIRAGEDLRGYYPVLLEIDPAGSAARVFPVQQRGVGVAEWEFEADPDVASTVLGLAVQPVLGIPYTADNAAFLGALQPSDELMLRMSTGRILHFIVSRTERVDRQDVTIFDQVTPGMVIVMLADPLGTRLVIHGVYDPAQEVGSSLVTSADLLPSDQPLTPSDKSFTLRVLEASASAGPFGSPLPSEWMYLLVDLELNIEENSLSGPQALEILIGSDRYTPVTVEEALLSLPSYSSGNSGRMTAAFLVPRSAKSASLLVRTSSGEQLGVALDYPPLVDLTADDLDVALLALTTEEEEEIARVVARLRFFNPHAQPITIKSSDIYAVFAPGEITDTFPVGPVVPPVKTELPIVVNPGMAIDLDVRFTWHDDPIVGLHIAGTRFVAQLR